MEEERAKGSGTTNGSAQTATTSQERGKESQRSEEQGHKDEDPAKAPHVVVILARGITTMATDERVRGVLGVAVPGFAKGRRGTSRAAVLIVAAAEVEIGPLGDVAGAGDAGGVGAEKVDLVERGDVADAGEDDEPQEEEGAAEEDDAGGAQEGVFMTLIFS